MVAQPFGDARHLLGFGLGGFELLGELGILSGFLDGGGVLVELLVPAAEIAVLKLPGDPGELVALQVISDYGEFCDGSVTAFSRAPRASTGALVLDCGFDAPSGAYAQCVLSDGGAASIADGGLTGDRCVFDD